MNDAKYVWLDVHQASVVRCQIHLTLGILVADGKIAMKGWSNIAEPMMFSAAK